MIFVAQCARGAKVSATVPVSFHHSAHIGNAGEFQSKVLKLSQFGVSFRIFALFVRSCDFHRQAMTGPGKSRGERLAGSHVFGLEASGWSHDFGREGGWGRLNIRFDVNVGAALVWHSISSSCAISEV